MLQLYNQGKSNNTEYISISMITFNVERVNGIFGQGNYQQVWDNLDNIILRVTVETPAYDVEYNTQEDSIIKKLNNS